ncbi:MAG: hypothetical protein IH984_17450, partial [Planctomycetes bacterium]|nr:hypothetical protein [Planctomycetota bacterium]
PTAGRRPRPVSSPVAPPGSGGGNGASVLVIGGGGSLLGESAAATAAAAARAAAKRAAAAAAKAVAAAGGATVLVTVGGVCVIGYLLYEIDKANDITRAAEEILRRPIPWPEDDPCQAPYLACLLTKLADKSFKDRCYHCRATCVGNGGVWRARTWDGKRCI